MSIESRGAAQAPVPRTAVSLGITDPVEKARAELKAALAAIEEKTNVPKLLTRAADDAELLRALAGIGDGKGKNDGDH